MRQKEVHNFLISSVFGPIVVVVFAVELWKMAVVVVVVVVVVVSRAEKRKYQ